MENGEFWFGMNPCDRDPIVLEKVPGVQVSQAPAAPRYEPHPSLMHSGTGTKPTANPKLFGSLLDADAAGSTPLTPRSSWQEEPTARPLNPWEHERQD